MTVLTVSCNMITFVLSKCCFLSQCKEIFHKSWQLKSMFPTLMKYCYYNIRINFRNFVVFAKICWRQMYTLFSETFVLKLLLSEIFIDIPTLAIFWKDIDRFNMRTKDKYLFSRCLPPTWSRVHSLIQAVIPTQS